MATNYEEKRQARIERYRNRAEKAGHLSKSLRQEATNMASVIPFGQPILVGHHSEQRDRNYRNRIDNKFRKSWEEEKKATYWMERARAAELNESISSDDPEALQKLQERLEKRERFQEVMKATNVALRKGDNQALRDLGFSEEAIAKLTTPDFVGRIGFADFDLRNNNAQIKRLKNRIAYLEKQAQDETTEETFGDVRVVDNTEENRVQVFFPEIPSEAIRKKLKEHGFRWSRTNKAWQRHRSTGGLYWARQIAVIVTGKMSEEASS